MAIMSLKKMLFAAVGITMAAAATLEELAKGCNVTTQVLEDLISIEDYANVDATKFAGFFQQPVEVVAKWPASVKKDILPLMAAEIKYYQNDQQGESPIMAMAAKTIAENGNGPNGKLSERNVDESAQYIQYRTQQLTLHEARMQASNSGCTQNAPCLACISSASLALLGAIAGCAATAAAEEAIWAGITFGIATAPIWLKLVACIATAGSVAAGAVGTCYTLL